MKFLKSFILPFTLVTGLLLSCNSSNTASAETLSHPVRIAALAPAVDTNFHDGDIIFQSSMSGQSYAVQLATHSKYSHCGMLFNDNGTWYVYEAVQPVTKTPVTQWIQGGDNDYFIVRRLKNADQVLTADALGKMRAYLKKNMGKNYDLAFNWSDERFYCSELVWKTYKEGTGLEIGALKKLGDYDLSSPAVKKKLTERYGNNIPMDEPMISPGAIFDSELLMTVKDGNSL